MYINEDINQNYSLLYIIY